ncbi:MAG: ATP-dependent DNA helicase RecG [Clostridia bacterium]|nr:ATP-dependent DNA helicase RecG [Clostridia bacterium]
MEKASELTKIKGIGSGRIKYFARLGLFSLQDLAGFLPRSYLDYERPVKIADAEDGEPAAIEIKFIGSVKTFRAKSGIMITTVSIGDETGNMTATWFNQPYIARSIPKEPGGYALGIVDKRTGARLLRASFSKELPGIIPVYPLTSGLTQNVMRSAVRGALEICLDEVEETLHEEIREEYGLIPLKTAMETVHFPKNADALAAARRRLAFEDAAVLTIVLEKLRQNRKGQKGIAFNTSGILDEFLMLLPFEPTGAQYSVMNEIALDMASPQPMSRLIQGDVGSGKTALALYAMLIAAKNGAQSALMAPTEILAEQHFALLKRFFGERAAILKGHMSASVKREVLKGIADGSIIAVTGTHALIEGKVEFKRLGVVITDEQHRFGVRQRAEIGKKAESPDTIIMSATPIPRTLSLILYGDLDVSLVKGMPPGRKPVITRLVPSAKRIAMYRYIEDQIKKECTQAYVVCPMIEENEEMERVRSAETLYEELRTNLSVRVALVHGKLKPQEKDSVMERFRRGEVDLLVSTTVIEVGVDVPNACTMVIESAERFGLAQLHQLRGRVGRGQRQSECYLLTESGSKSAIARLKLLTETNDGFKIAERDLETRGPGELIGMRQHGISEFGAAALASDIETLKLARDCARKLISMPEGKSERLMKKAMLKYERSIEDVVIN